MEARERMVQTQLRNRGIRDAAVLRAMSRVPREEFVPPDLQQFAYRDSPLPIGMEQTISQPYIVALMMELLELTPSARVLEVGGGSGYAAAVLAEVAGEVHSVERIPELAQRARATLRGLGYRNVHVHTADGSRGWPAAAPYDAIVVAAGGKDVPAALREQLRIGGCLVIPVGELGDQRLLRLRRLAENRFEEEDLGAVRFVPLVADEPPPGVSLADRVRTAAEPFESVAAADLTALLQRIGEARITLLGEASHGTSEFYQMRARITRALIESGGVRIVALEADWPDARRLDRYVRGLDHEARWEQFARFPSWMWRNQEMHEFVEWLRSWNGKRSPEQRAGIFGLDLYSLFTSLNRVLDYLDETDPEAARSARQDYACLFPWEKDPAAYGEAVLSRRYRKCEGEVVRVLEELLSQRLETDEWLDAAANARLVASAEEYYRTMYSASERSWNLRDTHMLETLRSLLDFYASRAVVWAHNSHIGDARATEMGQRGELNLGQLCRQNYPGQTYHVGFGTDRGTVAAATNWGDEVQIKTLQPSRAGSYEQICQATGLDNFFLPLKRCPELKKPRLERAIGVIYRPQSELLSHYFQASLTDQFDEWIWLGETRAVTPLQTSPIGRVPDTFPTGL